MGSGWTVGWYEPYRFWAGINQGGGPGSAGFEFMVLFRLTQPDRINDAPYEIRSGFTYNF